ncbi:hypothetical protein [Fimbriiglobus ruber]|uniref:Uncharacterized protein n=1 Tax=Fimbriiglobus ruber TaxID=1908690 RepID=A0A225DY01_9BACT|nr:hypothetical protein [Fimbriiglobus ruber]OWK40997.1 hypothetical protein FRUB_04889 [Fimbriiglobus ruber]
MADEADVPHPKFGAGHAQAMLRAGGKELGQALVALPDSTIRPVEEPGMVGNLTPQEIYRDKTAYESALDGYAARGGVGREPDRGLER